MLNALLDRDELLIALQHSAAQRRLRLGFLAAITGLFAWLATPAVALTWGVILGALEVLGGVIYEKQRARGIGAGTMRDHYVRIVLTMIGAFLLVLFVRGGVLGLLTGIFNRATGKGGAA